MDESMEVRGDWVYLLSKDVEYPGIGRVGNSIQEKEIIWEEIDSLWYLWTEVIDFAKEKKI